MFRGTNATICFRSPVSLLLSTRTIEKILMRTSRYLTEGSEHVHFENAVCICSTTRVNLPKVRNLVCITNGCILIPRNFCVFGCFYTSRYRSNSNLRLRIKDKEQFRQTFTSTSHEKRQKKLIARFPLIETFILIMFIVPKIHFMG